MRGGGQSWKQGRIARIVDSGGSLADGYRTPITGGDELGS